MADPVQGPGSVQNILGRRSETTTSNPREGQRNVETSREIRDEVQISEEAISLQQATQAARDVREELASSNQSLSDRSDAIQDLLDAV